MSKYIYINGEYIKLDSIEKFSFKVLTSKITNETIYLIYLNGYEYTMENKNKFDDFINLLRDCIGENNIYE